MNKQRIIQYIIYATVLVIVVYVGKSMFRNDGTIRNVPQNVSHETPSYTKGSEGVEDEKKFEFELQNQEEVHTLNDLYDEQTINQSKQLAEKFTQWAFPFGEEKQIRDVEGFVKGVSPTFRKFCTLSNFE